MTPKKQDRWVILVIFMMAHAVNDGFTWLIPPLLPAIRKYFQLSYTEMGAYYTLFNVFGNILQAPVAYLVHIAPASVIMVAGLLWLSIGMFLASLSSSYVFLVWMSAISGIGKSTYHPLALTLLSRVFGKDSLGRAMALHLSGSSIGHVIVPFMVGLLVTQFGWRLPLQIWSVLGLLAGISLFSFLKRQQENLPVADKVLRLPYFSRHLAIFLLAIGIWGISQSGLMTFLPLFLVDYRGFSMGNAAAVYGIMSLAGAVFRPALGALMDRMGRRKPVIIVGFIFAGLSILGLVSFKGQAAVYLFIILLGTFASGHSGLSDTLMIEMIPSARREETLGFILTLRMGIAALSPLVVGFLSERFGMTHVFLMLSVAPIVTALFISLVEEKPFD
ncbi:MAG: MFS transporter [Thermodesulfobacteriota bacterium]|nr:MFS transporter [Thermodesulfobacteriota bacterium]